MPCWVLLPPEQPGEAASPRPSLPYTVEAESLVTPAQGACLRKALLAALASSVLEFVKQVHLHFNHLSRGFHF